MQELCKKCRQWHTPNEGKSGKHCQACEVQKMLKRGDRQGAFELIRRGRLTTK